MASTDSAVACVANIGPAGRRRRLMVGVVGAVVCLLAANWLARGPAPLAWRLALFPAWFVSALAVFQAKEQTCVALAQRGQRDMDTGIEPMPEAHRGRVAAQSRKVYVQSIIAAALLSGLSLLLP
jgi:hypothetical protein